MASFEEDMQFAKDVLRIRDAILSGEIYEGIPTGWQFAENNTICLHSIRFRSDRGSRFFGEINSSCYDIEKSNSQSSITTSYLTYVDDGKDATISRSKEAAIVEYNEELHFQHSLLYSDEQLRVLVALSMLRFNPARKCVYLKLKYEYIPVLAKLLRYKDYGII